MPSVVGDSVQQRWDPAHSRHSIGALVVQLVIAVVMVMVMAVVAEVLVIVIIVVVDVGLGGEIGSMVKVQGQ